MYSIKTALDIEKYCHTNQKNIKGTIREVLIVFQGLGRSAFFTQPCSGIELEWAHEGILMVIPYTQPWSWMNENTVRYMNWLMKEIFEVFHLSDNCPIVSTGFSMGGLEALIYPLYSEYPVSAVMANSPVCDLLYHFTEREDLPRTLLCAFIGYDGGFEAGLRSRSPIHQVDQLPDIPYMIVSGGSDVMVNEKYHAIPFVKAMRERHKNIVHYSCQTMQHWAIDDYDTHRKVLDFVSGAYQNRSNANEV